MKNHQHPWNLRRIFGRQFVGYVGRPACHETGIAARVIPAQSSRWTSREPEDADLPTCRLADFTPATVQVCPPPSTPRLWISPQVSSPGHACPFKAQQLFDRPLRCYRAVQSSSILSFPLETARNHFFKQQPN